MDKKYFIAKQKIKSILRCGINFVSDKQKCILCNKTSIKYSVCPECNKTFYSVANNDTKICKICGKTLVSEDELCFDCRENPVLKTTEHVFTLYSYRLWNVTLMIRWKLDEDRSLSQFFSEKIHQKIMELSCGNSDFQDIVLVPVPPRPGKIKEKGWDQVRDLCDYLQYKYGHKIDDCLVRNTVVEQKKLDKEERLSTIENAYSYKNENFLQNVNVCIIDDVITTGSTIECCARILKNHGAKKVYAISLFIVD